MTDKEFKNLSKAQLIDIIYQLQVQVDKLTEQKQKLDEALADKHIRINSAGSIADAALEINGCFRSAQNAAELYLAEIRKLRDSAQADRMRILFEAENEAARMVSKAKEESQQLLSAAKKEAEEIVSSATRTKDEYETAIEAILKEFGESDE